MGKAKSKEELDFYQYLSYGSVSQLVVQEYLTVHGTNLEGSWNAHIKSASIYNALISSLNKPFNI